MDKQYNGPSAMEMIEAMFSGLSGNVKAIVSPYLPTDKVDEEEYRSTESYAAINGDSKGE